MQAWGWGRRYDKIDRFDNVKKCGEKGEKKTEELGEKIMNESLHSKRDLMQRKYHNPLTPNIPLKCFFSQTHTYKQNKGGGEKKNSATNPCTNGMQPKTM